MNLVPGARQSQSTVEKIQRLVFWNSETLLQVLRRIVAKRTATHKRRLFKEEMFPLESAATESSSPLQEVQEPIVICTERIDFGVLDSSAFELPEKVEEQLLDYVTTISTLCRKVNQFSNVSSQSNENGAFYELGRSYPVTPP